MKRKMFRVIVAGGREFDNYELLTDKLDYYLQHKMNDGSRIVIVSGTARGADKLGEKYAINSEFDIARYPANWTLGKRAGYIRNAQMADNADACVCFWDGKSRGTKHMIDLAKEKNLLVKVVMY